MSKEWHTLRLCILRHDSNKMQRAKTFQESYGKNRFGLVVFFSCVVETEGVGSIPETLQRHGGIWKTEKNEEA